jgi:hypothetical protein
MRVKDRYTGVRVYLGIDYENSMTIYDGRFTTTKCTRVDDTVHLPVGKYDEMVDVYPFTYEKGYWVLGARKNTITREQSMEEHREYIRKLDDNGCIDTL